LTTHGMRCNTGKLRKNLGESELSFVDEWAVKGVKKIVRFY
jgi:hypothetical protein